ncbi:hypothetical protein INT43_008877 [Umbelopsis isabellina]|uniref:Uncharacterized protein n=1 Tax=Mortierella isabellina TaxID=91625 RepID=A0A8H7PXJ5_MORIS|nr:hypothetical protein INT43_008877 [Umbelopsis isabellina]
MEPSPVPVLIRAAGTCFAHCSSWMILCGGVGLAASIIDMQSKNIITQVYNQTRRQKRSCNSLIQIMQAERQCSLLGSLINSEKCYAHVVRRDSKPKEREPKQNHSPCVQSAAKEPKREKIDKKVTRVSKRKRPASKQVDFMQVLKAPKALKLARKVNNKRSADIKCQSPKWKDAIDSDQYVNPHLLSVLQKYKGNTKDPHNFVANLMAMLFLFHTAYLQLSFTQLTV